MATAYHNLSDYDFNSVPDAKEMKFGIVVSESVSYTHLSNFDAAYACLRQVSFGLLDMAWYTRTTPFDGDVKVCLLYTSRCV